MSYYALNLALIFLRNYTEIIKKGPIIEIVRLFAPRLLEGYINTGQNFSLIAEAQTIEKRRIRFPRLSYIAYILAYSAHSTN